MSGERDVRSLVEDMVLACEHVIAVTRGISDAQLLDENDLFYGDMLHQMTLMGEAAKHVPERLRGSRPEIPWTRIVGLRDMIVHHYFGLDSDVLIDVVRQTVPRDLPVLRSLLAELEAED